MSLESRSKTMAKFSLNLSLSWPYFTRIQLRKSATVTSRRLPIGRASRPARVSVGQHSGSRLQSKAAARSASLATCCGVGTETETEAEANAIRGSASQPESKPCNEARDMSMLTADREPLMAHTNAYNIIIWSAMFVCSCGAIS